MNPLVSICIPAYEQLDLLVRCLQSVESQQYPHIEVIVTDDSRSEKVKSVCNAFVSRLSLTYHKNNPALGSPANWNTALNKASGHYRLLLHHDDWLAIPQAISKYVAAFTNNPEVHGVFGQTVATIKEGVQQVQEVNLSLIHNNPLLLLQANKIGPPSNLMLRADVAVQYDVKYKWLVDIDYYIRILQAGYKLHHLPETLIGVGVHAGQTTNIFTQNPLLVLKEYLFFARTYASQLSGWKLYDRYWRLIRNSGVAHSNKLHATLDVAQIPPFVSHIIAVQKKWPASWLRFGPFSKGLMWVHYLSYGFGTKFKNVS